VIAVGAEHSSLEPKRPLPIDYDAGALFTRLNFLIGLEVANADERPAWNPDDYFGRTFGRKSR